MGGRITYPDVDDSTMIQIFKQSCHTPIQGYGYFVNPIEAYSHVFPLDSEDQSMHTESNYTGFMEQMEETLQAAGLHHTHIAWYNTPKSFRAQSKCLAISDGWLVVLGTGFDKQLHVPLPDGLLERVQGILRTTEEPKWWSMRSFSYPPPLLVIASRKRKDSRQET